MKSVWLNWCGLDDHIFTFSTYNISDLFFQTAKDADSYYSEEGLEYMTDLDTH